MKKKEVFIIVFICLIVIIIAGLGIKYILQGSMDKYIINRIIKNNYSEYKITDAKYKYVDFFSTVRTADASNPPTQATITIEKEGEERIIYLKKHLFVWKIEEDNVNSGSNIPNDKYYIEVDSLYVGSAVNIEEHIKERKYWIIPDEDGNDYTRAYDGYYNLSVCKKLYKTENHNVYEYSEEDNDWVLSAISYSDLLHYSNYDEIEKSEVMNLIQKYGSKE